MLDLAFDQGPATLSSNGPGVPEVEHTTLSTTTASSPLGHSVSVSGFCGTVSRSLSVTKVQPALPSLAMSFGAQAPGASATIQKGQSIPLHLRFAGIPACSFILTLTERRASDGAVTYTTTSVPSEVNAAPYEDQGGIPPGGDVFNVSPASSSTYTATVTCANDPSLTETQSILLNIPPPPPPPSCVPAGTQGVHAVDVVNATGDDTITVWVLDHTTGVPTMVGDLLIGDSTTVTLTDCHYTDIITVSWNRVNAWNESFGLSQDPHSWTTAQDTQFDPWYAIDLIGRSSDPTLVQNVSGS